MTLDDAASILDITEKSVVRLLRAGALKGSRVKVAGKWRYNLLGKDVRARRRRLRTSTK